MKQYLSVVIVFGICILAITGAWIWRVSQSNNRTNIDTLNQNIQINSTKPVNVYEDNSSSEIVKSNDNNTEKTFSDLLKEYVSYNTKYAKVYAEKVKEDSEAKVSDVDMQFTNNYTFGKWQVQNNEVAFVVTDSQEFEVFAGKTLDEMKSQYKWIKGE